MSTDTPTSSSSSSLPATGRPFVKSRGAQGRRTRGRNHARHISAPVLSVLKQGSGDKAILSTPNVPGRQMPQLMDLDFFSSHPNSNMAFLPVETFGVLWPPGPLLKGPQRYPLSEPMQPPVMRGRPFMHHAQWRTCDRVYGDRVRGRGPCNKRPDPQRLQQFPSKKVKSNDEVKNMANYCDACDRGFIDMDGHIERHTQCGIDGCSYVASKKLVKLHQKMQHKTGLADKIWKIECEESIDKWRHDRRKNFPTLEKIKEKHSEMSTKIASGEILETKQFGKFGRDRGRDHDRVLGRGRGHHKALGRGIYGNMKTGSQDATVIDKRYNNVGEKSKDMANDPMAMFAEKNSDDETDPESGEKQSCIGGALGSLMYSYGNGSEDEEEETKGPPVVVVDVTMAAVIDDVKNDEFVAVVETPKPAISAMRGFETASKADENQTRVLETELITELEYYKELENAIKTGQEKPKNRNRGQGGDLNQGRERILTNQRRRDKRDKGRRGRGGRGSYCKDGDCKSKQFYRKSTLLEKLLAPDIRHERNVILQCVRFICKNDFFGQTKIVQKTVVIDLT